MDSLLKYGLPLMWHYKEVFCHEPKDSKELLQFIPEGEEDAAEILMASGQWIKIWKVINEEEEILLWSLKNVPGNQKLILLYPKSVTSRGHDFLKYIQIQKKITQKSHLSY